jgi:hypothetical protein
VISLNTPLQSNSVLYGCETWSLTLKEEHSLRVFDNMVLRRIFGPEREEVVRGWRRLNSEGFHNLYASPRVTRVTKSRTVRRVGHVARMGQMMNVYKCWSEYLKERDHSKT